ncbi:carbamoyltransferase HypF [Geopsychrobacter electrodiphilus]|uniref:carbamoyltransferase HypF n=1 Tax=Geopsychrobacter electrodiphilus TaxID=225196 RepID=UPI000366E8CE|nr:carbamoyltransferase HypF [Geopsychrobacter electrodiphilus]
MLNKRHVIRVEGIVQGVGFRPFIYRQAQLFALNGWVYNDTQGVLIEVEGPESQFALFLTAIRTKLPPLAHISCLSTHEIPLTSVPGFAIRDSRHSVQQSTQISPDAYVCPDCLSELFAPEDRRFRYPFINCTNCGPRYSIVCGVPYDRPLTTMVDFPLCQACQQEYDDPTSRRFHAQPNACTDCGPALGLFDQDGVQIPTDDPLAESLVCLQQGEVLAIKGLGGFHLAVDAQNCAAVARLRQRKFRDEKPFALMAKDIQTVGQFAHLGAVEKRLLESVERPIVLLEKKLEQTLICELTAPNNRYLGVMLPYTPLHYLLFEAFPALIMTSGNQSDEPIAYGEAEAFARLNGIADVYLSHNRRIQIRTDDSIVRVMNEEPLMLRRSRGYVPRAVKLNRAQPSVLALGADLKNTICLTADDRATLSHHIGDLKNQAVLDSLKQAVEHLQQLHHIQPQLVAHDLHPDYFSTSVAMQMTHLPKLAVQHHHAHLVSCLTDNGRDEPVLGVIFDGVGYGSDGHIWGGEFLLGDAAGFERVGHLAELAMPGGDAATREPWRMALSLLVAAYGENLPALAVLEDIPPVNRRLLLQMMHKEINTPLTSSCGRLFDAVASLAGLRQTVSYEGQAALELEMRIDKTQQLTPYRFELLDNDGKIIVNPRPMVHELVADLQQGRDAGAVSLRFHLGLAEAILQVCQRIRARQGALPIALSGGVFQNVFLTERVTALLRAANFEVLLHRQTPPNDGGLALGQVVIAGRYLDSLKLPDCLPGVAGAYQLDGYQHR